MTSKAFFRAIQEDDVPDIIGLTSAESWPSYAPDAVFAWKVLSAPGTGTVVDEDPGET